MIVNKLTEQEFERLMTPVLRLEECEVIKRKVYEVLQVWQYSPTDKRQYFTRGECSGVCSTYRGFEIDVRGFNDPKNHYTGTIIQLKKNRGVMDALLNPNRQLVAKLKELCERELLQTLDTMFMRLNLGPQKDNSSKEELLYLSGVLNPKWNEPTSGFLPLVNPVSPLSIFTQESHTGFITEFWFFPECFERQGNKTRLKQDCLEILEQFPPHL